MEKAIGLALFLAITSGTAGISPLIGVGAQGLELKSPSLEFLAIGGNSLLPSSILPEPKIIKTVKVVVTAYSSSVFETDDTPTITASNTEVRDGIIANNLLPFGTKVRLPELYGDKIFVVEDRMNRRKGSYHFDIWFPSYREAKNFGAQNTYLEVLAN
ncbi:MAG: 3D domain-containing protein [Candidatus Nealsonbacteria bacterium]|nr:3D domain-containing protein [Candidatus Nealsonbacteria bacterium]